MRDLLLPMHGKLEILKKYQNGQLEKVFEGNNAITYRAKTIMSRLLSAGLAPNDSPTDALGKTKVALWGTGSDQLRVTGMTFGNGGHLIYTASGGTTASLPKDPGDTNGLIVHSTSTGAVTSKPAMPYIGSGNYGYAGQTDRFIPGTTYEQVENGNVPWDGTVNIQDNAVGVTEANTTLYSETFRIPLDDTATSTDGYSFPTKSEVQFKATLGDSYLNYTGRWGFSAQPANLISEAGLIVGYRPDSSALATGQVYSNDGNEPSLGGGGFDFGAGATNFGTPTASPTSKQEGLYSGNDTVPPTVTNGVDTWPSGNNTWNLLARKTFPAITKSSEFSLVFVWTISF